MYVLMYFMPARRRRKDEEKRARIWSHVISRRRVEISSIGSGVKWVLVQPSMKI
jgi:hypothetical protein